MSTAYPPNGSIVSATVVQWDDRFLIAEDGYGLPYIHWYEDDRRWNNIWQEHMRSGRLPLKLRVGRADGPRGRKAFIADLDMAVTVQQPQQPEVTRSPHDVFKAPAPTYEQATAQLDQLIDDIGSARPKRNRSDKGKPTLSLAATGRAWTAADILGWTLSEVCTACLEEGRTPEALVASRGK